MIFRSSAELSARPKLSFYKYILIRKHDTREAVKILSPSTHVCFWSRFLHTAFTVCVILTCKKKIAGSFFYFAVFANFWLSDKNILAKIFVKNHSPGTTYFVKKHKNPHPRAGELCQMFLPRGKAIHSRNPPRPNQTKKLYVPINSTKSNSHKY